MAANDLSTKIKALEQRLEATPDPWFAEPVGWLSKPDFKRKEQLLSNYTDGRSKGRSMTLSGMMGKKTYSRRYFALVGTQLSYYREIEAETPAGAVDLLEVRQPTSVGRVTSRGWPGSWAANEPTRRPGS